MGDWEGVSVGGEVNLNKTLFKRLGYTDKIFEIFTQNEHLPAQRFKVLDENSKIVMNMGILKNKSRPPTSPNFQTH